MPAARGVKRTASKSSASTASAGPKNKKKRNVVQLEVPTLPKRRGRVLTCGQGDVGQLGLGEDVMETTRFKHVIELGEKIVDVCAGGMHTIALDSDGKVWTFGCNDEGALGRPTGEDSEEGRAMRVSLPRRAVAICAGDSHSAALLDNGDVYAWGSFRDSHGGMGLVVRGREGKACREPIRIELTEPVADIASGGDHLVLLTTSGSVFTLGCGEQGQLGRLAQRSASRDTRQGFSALLAPARVTLKAGAARVWAGYHATFALDAARHKMFAWGLNNYGQLGITGEKRKTALYSPTECDAFPAGAGWRCVAPGQHHSLALDDAGQVYAIGRCEYGRLGLGDRSGDAEVLEPIPKLQNKKCISIAAGTSNSFAVTDSGEIFAWGMGSEGQLGTGKSEDAAEPTPAVSNALTDRTPIHVSAGGQHTVLLVEDPNAQKEPSPAPEKETAAQTEEMSADEEPVPEPEKKPKGRAGRRRKQEEQEDQVSSTSSAQPSDVAEDAAPQKVNGDEKKETAMEVDETDSKQDKKEDSEHKEAKLETTDTSSQGTEDSDITTPLDSQDVEMKEPSTAKDPLESNPEESKPESKDKTESNSDKTDSVDKAGSISEKAGSISEKAGSISEKAGSVDKGSKLDKAEVNGAPEETVEAKTVEALADQPLTTSA